MGEIPELLTRRTRSEGWLKRGRERGLITGVLPGVNLRADVASAPYWRARAVMAWRPDAVLCGEFAAQRTFWKELDVGVIEVATRTAVRRESFRFVKRAIPAQLQTQLGWFRIASPALTALDLSLTRGPEAIERALRSRMVTVEQLDSALAASPNRSGNADRRRQIADSRTRPWSAAERIAHQLLREAGIGGWVANHPITLDLWTFYLDIAFLNLKLVIEIDGYELHSQRAVFEQDRERQNDLVLDRWTVLRFTYRQLTRHPGYVIDTIRSGMRVAAELQRRRATRTRPESTL